MKRTALAMAIAFLLAFTSQALAYDLMVLSGENSKNSKKWQQEVLPEYPSSDIGKAIPLKKVLTLQGTHFPQWLDEAMQKKQVGEIVGTPTFIIWDAENQREAGRVEGYTEKSRFYSMMNEALAQIEQGMRPGFREGSAGHQQEEGSGSHREEGSGSRHDDGAASRHQEGSGGAQSGPPPTMSRDIMDHMYKTPEEAKRASEMLGFGGEIHTHDSPGGTIYMPGPMM